jgi:hypothetical protein
MAMAATMAATPTSTETRDPNRMAESTSRPWSSVPRRKVAFPPSCQAGGSEASARSSVLESKTWCGAIQGANRDESTYRPAIVAATITAGERRKL